MKRSIFILGCILCFQKCITAQNYKTSWMSSVKSWQVSIEVEYLDSQNATNFTKVYYKGSGIISNEVMPLGSIMTWPQSTYTIPDSLLQIPVKGFYTKRYAEEPGPMQVDDWTCSGKIDEKILVSIGATLNGKYISGIPYLPTKSLANCSGKNPPDASLMNDIATVDFNPSENESVFVKDCGTSRHTLSDTIKYSTAEGAKIKVKYSYFPM